MNHEFTVKVRFSETDLLGHVNNTSYFIYLEEARSEFFEDMGNQTKFHHLIMASTKCDFVDQAYFQQILKVKTGISRIGNKSFEFYQEIVDEKTENIIARGNSTVVCYDFEKQESIQIPDNLRELLERYLITVQNN